VGRIRREVVVVVVVRELSADRSLGIRRSSFMMFYLPEEVYFIVEGVKSY